MIPISTTTVRTWRKSPTTEEDPWGSGYDAPAGAFAILEEGVRAVIAVGGGSQAGQTVGPGDSESVRFNLLADPCDLQYLDEVEDEITGQRYQVEWAISSPGIDGMLSSVRAGLTTRKGT